MAMVLISHDLGLVRRVADSVHVMEKGLLVESGPTAHVTLYPRQAYTKTLLAAEDLPRAASARATGEPLLRADHVRIVYPGARRTLPHEDLHRRRRCLVADRPWRDAWPYRRIRLRQVDVGSSGRKAGAFDGRHPLRWARSPASQQGLKCGRCGVIYRSSSRIRSLPCRRGARSAPSSARAWRSTGRISRAMRGRAGPPRLWLKSDCPKPSSGDCRTSFPAASDSASPSPARSSWSRDSSFSTNRRRRSIARSRPTFWRFCAGCRRSAG